MKSIAIITPKTDTFSNPILVILFERLIKENYKILFFAFDQLRTRYHQSPGDD